MGGQPGPGVTMKTFIQSRRSIRASWRRHPYWGQQGSLEPQGRQERSPTKSSPLPKPWKQRCDIPADTRAAWGPPEGRGTSSAGGGASPSDCDNYRWICLILNEVNPSISKWPLCGAVWRQSPPCWRRLSRSSADQGHGLQHGGTRTRWAMPQPLSLPCSFAGNIHSSPVTG